MKKESLSFKLISKQEAKLRGLKTYFTGIPCLKGHIYPRRVQGSVCIKCDRDKFQKKKLGLKSQRNINALIKKKAKEKNLKRYFTGIPCKNGHIAERFVSTRLCVICAKDKVNLNKDYYRNYQKTWSKTEKGIQSLKNIRLKYYQANKELCKERRKLWISTNKGREIARKISNRAWKKLASTPEGRIEINLRSYLKRVLKDTSAKKFNKFRDIIGCSRNELKKHLESKFKKGMNWDNYGVHGWHIDHIVPVSYYKKNCDFLKSDTQKKCFHFSNLQPLWAKENIQKSNKLGNFSVFEY